MTDIQAVIKLLGSSADDQRVQDLLRDAGATSGPKLKQGDTSTYVEVPTEGLYFVFTDEGFFRKTRGAKIGAGPLLLTNVTVYCAPTGKYSAYIGALPAGLLPSDSRDAARAKLGVPEVAVDRRRLDRWSIDNVWVYAVYSANLQAIERAGIQFPDA